MSKKEKKLATDNTKSEKNKKSGQMFKTKAFRAGGYSVAAAAIVIVIVIVINLLVSSLSTAYTNIDTSAAGVFSLSEQTKEVVSALDKEVHIYYLTTTDTSDTYVDKLLDKFAAKSKNLTVERINPDLEPDFASEYTDDEIATGDFLVVCGDKSKVVSSADMITYEAGSYEYYQYYLQQGTETAIYWNGEIQLLKAIDYVTTTETYKVYFIDDSGKADFSPLTKLLDNENITCETLTLDDSQTIPEDASCVVLTNLSADITLNDYNALTRYLSGGGKLYLAADYSKDDYTNLKKLMTDYGLSFTKATLEDGDLYYSEKSTLMPAVTGEHAIIAPFSKANYIIFPEAMGIESDKTDNVTVTPILKTSESAYFSTDAADNLQFNTYDVGVVVNNSVTDAQIVVFGTSSYTDDEYLSNSTVSNSDLFVNSVGYLCNKDSAVAIHAKEVANEAKLDFSNSSTGLLICAFAVIPAFISIAVGFSIWYRRKNS